MSASLKSLGKTRSKWRYTAPLATLFVIGIAYTGWKLKTASADSATQYTTSPVEHGNIENLVTATGILQPRDYVDVGAQVSGQLKKLYVEVGSQVKAGDLLAEIDPTVYRAKVDGIRAQLRNQQAQLKDRQAQLKLAGIQWDRQKNLQKDDATTTESLQTAQAGVESAQAQREVLEATIQQTQSSLRAEEANLEYAKIYAPIDGTVVSITSRQGQTLNANQQAPTIMRVADLTTMTVQAQVSEADISKLQTGMDVYFTTLGGQNARWSSTLGQIQPTPEVTNNVVLYNALFDVPNPDGRLMTQMSAQIFFVAAQAKDTLLIPASAVNLSIKTDDKAPAEDERRQPKTESNGPAGEKPEGARRQRENREGGSSQAGSKENGPSPAGSREKPTFVHIMKPDGSIERRRVKLGVSNRVQVQVQEGLQAGEVVISGIRTAKKPATKPGTTPSGPGFGGGGFR